MQDRGGRRGVRAAGTALLLLLVACRPEASSKPHAGRVVIGVRADPGTFNVYTATNAFAQEVSDLLQLRLAEEGDDFQEHPPTFRPMLARSWEFSTDRMQLTLHLDPEARWSDGSPVTSEDVLFSHRAATDPGVGWVGRDVKEWIVGTEAPDAHTVVYRFSRVYPYQLMDAVEGNVVPSRVLGRIPFADWPKTAFLEAALTSGPFRLARYERGSIVELARNPTYLRAGAPELESVVFRIIPEESTLVSELLSGGVDVVENVPAADLARVEADPRLRVARTSDLSYTFLCWNTSRPPFSDARVRKALTLAIDRNAIVEGLLHGSGRESVSPIPSMLWAHDPELQALPYDPAQAMALLEQAGCTERQGRRTCHGKPFRFELETSQESGLRSRVAEMVASQLARVGIEAVVRPLEFGAFVEKHERHDFDAFVGSWKESTKVDLKSIFHSAAAQGGYNYGLYANPELDSVIERARAETDPDSARHLWWRAQEIIAADQPYTFLFERDRFHAAPRDLEGFSPTPRSVYAGLERWRWSTRGGS